MAESAAPTTSLPTTVKVLVKHGSTVHPIPAAPDATLEAFQALVADHVGVSVSGQRLIFKGKNLMPDTGVTLAGAGIKNGSSVMLLGKVFDPLSDETGRKLTAVRGKAHGLHGKLRATL